MTKTFGAKMTEALQAKEQQRTADQSTFNTIVRALNNYAGRNRDKHRVSTRREEFEGDLSYEKMDVCTFSVRTGTIRVHPNGVAAEVFQDADAAVDRMAVILADAIAALDAEQDAEMTVPGSANTLGRDGWLA